VAQRGAPVPCEGAPDERRAALQVGHEGGRTLTPSAGSPVVRGVGCVTPPPCGPPAPAGVPQLLGACAPGGPRSGWDATAAWASGIGARRVFLWQSLEDPLCAGAGGRAAGARAGGAARGSPGLLGRLGGLALALPPDVRFNLGVLLLFAAANSLFTLARARPRRAAPRSGTPEGCDTGNMWDTGQTRSSETSFFPSGIRMLRCTRAVPWPLVGV